MKNIILIIAILSIFSLSLNSVFAATIGETQATANIIKVQWAVTPWTPPAPSTPPWMSQKGYVWEILARIFDGNQKITNYFILALQSIMGGNNNNVPKWNGTQFVASMITDTGTMIWIWKTNPTQVLDINWNAKAVWFQWDGALITNINGDNIQNNTIDASEIEANAIWNSEINNADAFTMWQLTTNGKLFLNQWSSYDVWIEWNGTSWSFPRNLALLWNKGSDTLYVNYASEYSGGTVIGWNVVISWGTMSGDYIQDNTVDSTEIQDNSITGNDIAANAIRNSELADWAVDSGSIQNYSIQGIDIAANTITSWKIASNSINGSELNNASNFTMANLDVTGRIKWNFACRVVDSGWNFPWNSTANCSSDEFVMSGWAQCYVARDDMITLSRPLGDLSGWTADCSTYLWNNASQRAYAVCCKK